MSSIVSTSVASTVFEQGNLANPQSAGATASVTAQQSGSPTTAAHKGGDLLTESRRVCLVTGLAVWKGEVFNAFACSACMILLKWQLGCCGEGSQLYSRTQMKLRYSWPSLATQTGTSIAGSSTKPMVSEHGSQSRRNLT